MPAEPRGDVKVTDPELARQLVVGQRALRRSMVMSIVLDVLVAAVLIAMGLPALLVVPAAVLIIGISVFALRRVIRAEEARLEHFRDPASGEIRIPGA